MFRTQTDTITDSPDRLLRPARALARLRPVRLAVLYRELRDAAWLAKALELLRTHFPANVPDRVSNLGWEGTLRGFLILAEENLFPIDWAHLDYLYEYWNSVDGEEGEEPETKLAGYLVHIPAKLFNFGEEALMNWVSEEHPWFVVLAGVVSDRINLAADYLIDLEIYDALADVTRAELWHRLDQPAAFEGLPEPLCWLPELARMAACMTGNPLLDGWRDGWEMAFEECWEPFRWDSDVERVAGLWQAARPVVEHWAEFDTWVQADHPWNLQKAVYLILGWQDAGDEDDDENDDGLWLDPAAARQNNGGER